MKSSGYYLGDVIENLYNIILLINWTWSTIL